MGEVVEVQPGTSEAQGLLARSAVALARGRWKAAEVDSLALLGLARAAARGRGPFEVALGEGLEELDRRGGLVTLGRSGVGDVGLEDLDVSPECARRVRRDAVELLRRPLLRAAVLAGQVSLRKAEVLLERTPRGEDAYWTARAKVEPVQYLELHAGRGSQEDWLRVQLQLPPGHGAVLELALEMARLLEGGGLTRLRQMECLLMEFVSSYRPPRSPFGPTLAQEWRLPPAKVEAQEEEVQQEGEEAGPFDAYAALARLKVLARQRACVDETLRRACLLVKRSRAHCLVGFPSFPTWCREWLGLPSRTVNHLLHLQEALDAVPEVAAALQAGTLTKQKALHVGARALARRASAEEVAAMVVEAAARPAVDAQRAARAAREARNRQMCDAGRFGMVVPTSVARLFQDALAGGVARWPGASPGQVLLEVAWHFIQVWKLTLQRLARNPSLGAGPDLGPCNVPGCSRRAEHLHHIWWRSHGGPDAEWNLVPLCAMHHHRCVHGGTVWVFGRSPDELRWFVGAREVKRARGLGYQHGLAPWEQPGWRPDARPAEAA